MVSVHVIQHFAWWTGVEQLTTVSAMFYRHCCIRMCVQRNLVLSSLLHQNVCAAQSGFMVTVASECVCSTIWFYGHRCIRMCVQHNLVLWSLLHQNVCAAQSRFVVTVASECVCSTISFYHHCCIRMCVQHNLVEPDRQLLQPPAVFPGWFDDGR